MSADHQVFTELAGKLFDEFYPDVRMFVADMSKDICNRIPTAKDPMYDGVLMTVIMSCLCKEMALVMAPIQEDLVHEMIARTMFCIQAWVPEMKEELENYLKREHGNE